MGAVAVAVDVVADGGIAVGGAGVGLGAADGELMGCVLVGAADGGGEGRGVRGDASVAMAIGPRVGKSVAGVLVTTTTGADATGALRFDRCMSTAMSAPIPKPATTTPIPIAMVGSQPPPSPFEFGAAGRRRRGGVDIAARVQRGRQEASLTGANRTSMIRVSVPIDLNAVVTNASAAFALVTPLRLADIVATAVVVSLGERAPADKRERAVRRTLDGLHAGEFVVEIDGRAYTDAHDVVVCGGIITLRFFARRAYRRAA